MREWKVTDGYKVKADELSWDELKNATENGAGGLDGKVDEMIDAATDKVSQFIGENEQVKAVKEKIESVVGDIDENSVVNTVKEKLNDVIGDNGVVDNLKEKVGDVLENFTDNETAKKVTDFVKEHSDDASEMLKSVTDNAGKSGFWQKLKGLFGGK